MYDNSEDMGAATVPDVEISIGNCYNTNMTFVS
jgi:hypothetical protein